MGQGKPQLIPASKGNNLTTFHTAREPLYILPDLTTLGKKALSAVRKTEGKQLT